MRANAYDRARAAALLPLLRAISSEILERRAAIHRLEPEERALAATPRNQRDLQLLQAELASHRYELRRALAELAALGCRVSEGGPLTIHIPDQWGDLARGFSWRPGQVGVRRAAGAGV